MGRRSKTHPKPEDALDRYSTIVSASRKGLKIQLTGAAKRKDHTSHSGVSQAATIMLSASNL